MAPEVLADLICALSAQVHATNAAVSAGSTHVPYSDAPDLIVAEYPAHLRTMASDLERLPDLYRMVVMGLASIQGPAGAPEHERHAVAYSVRCLDDVLGRLLAALVRDRLAARPSSR